MNDTQFRRDVLQMLSCHSHIWIEEQQTGHRVCGWCNYCEGGCATPSPKEESE